MRAYHEVNPDSLGSVLTKGLYRVSRGEKGGDPLIKKTDNFLDERRPRVLKEQGLSRDDNIYAYIATDHGVIDIEDGKELSLGALKDKDDLPVLEIDIEPARCFVSNLDTYDAMKQALERHEEPAKLENVATAFWHNLVPLSQFTRGKIPRPEIMITYDIPANKIKKA